MLAVPIVKSKSQGNLKSVLVPSEINFCESLTVST